MHLEEFYDYKNRLMKELCSNAEIVKLVTGNEDAAVPNHGLPYTQIFPFEFIPETVEEGKTFICFDVDIASVHNQTLYFPVIYIWEFTHKSRMRTPNGGILNDRLAAEIDKQLNGSRFYGMGKLRLHSVQRFSPITDFLGRTMTYYTTDFNRPSTSQNANLPSPSNRKKGI